MVIFDGDERALKRFVCVFVFFSLLLFLTSHYICIIFDDLGQIVAGIL